MVGTNHGFEGAVDRLINYEAIDDRELEATISRIRASNPTAAHPDKPEIGNPGLEVALWLTRMLITKRPLQEKMALFWHGTSPPPSHGTSLPMFVIGGSIKGGVYGNNSNLTDLDTGDLRMQIGFRAVYASVVRNWLGVDPTRISQGNWADIPLTLQPHP